MQNEHPREYILPEQAKERHLLNELNKYRLTPALLFELQKHVHCDLCKKPVDDIEAHHFQWNRYYILIAKCHGEKEECKVTELDFVQIVKNKFIATVFKQAEQPKLETTQLKLENGNSNS
jgi:hypothetical protein